MLLPFLVLLKQICGRLLACCVDRSATHRKVLVFFGSFCSCCHFLKPNTSFIMLMKQLRLCVSVREKRGTERVCVCMCVCVCVRLYLFSSLWCVCVWLCTFCLLCGVCVCVCVCCIWHERR